MVGFVYLGTGRGAEFRAMRVERGVFCLVVHALRARLGNDVFGTILVIHPRHDGLHGCAT